MVTSEPASYDLVMLSLLAGGSDATGRLSERRGGGINEGFFRAARELDGGCARKSTAEQIRRDTEPNPLCSKALSSSQGPSLRGIPMDFLACSIIIRRLLSHDTDHRGPSEVPYISGDVVGGHGESAFQALDRHVVLGRVEAAEAEVLPDFGGVGAHLQQPPVVPQPDFRLIWAHQDAKGWERGPALDPLATLHTHTH